MASLVQPGVNPLTGHPYSPMYDVLRHQWQNLPVAKSIPELKALIQKHQVLVLVAETGSGKTTQFAKALLELFAKKIALTQPRRLAALLTGSRIAAELDVPLGGIVGIKYRGFDRSSANTTRLEVCTDGTLISAAKRDPSLSAYSVIVIDEAHQHTVPTDILLGLLKALMSKRQDLKIVIMSATINAKIFKDFFGDAAFIKEIEGRQFPVDVRYLPTPPPNPNAAIIDTVLQVHLTQQHGNILVFVSGVREIFQVISGVERALKGPTGQRFGPNQIGPLTCWPLHAQLSQTEQDRAIQAIAPVAYGKIGRKLIVATNVAEASITLEGITHVIDSCRYKSKVWNPREESWSLRKLWISKAQANQRSGRAGRERPGTAIRMCTRDGFNEQLSEQPVPAILEGDMLSEVLDILKMKLNPLDFPYVERPATETIVKAYGLLRELDLIQKGGDELTERGLAVASVPVSVYSAMAILASPVYGCSDEIISLVAVIEASDGGSQVFVKTSNPVDRAKVREARSKFLHPSGDHITLFNIYMAWRAACLAGTEDKFVADYWLLPSTLRDADRTRKQLLKILATRKDWTEKKLLRTLSQRDPKYYSWILRALAAGYFLQVAKREFPDDGPVYWTVRQGLLVKLTKDTELTCLHKDWVIYNELHTDGSKKTIRLVSAIPPEYLVQAAPAYWYDAEFRPEGHIQDDLCNVLAGMTRRKPEEFRGGMPPPPGPVSAP